MGKLLRLLLLRSRSVVVLSVAAGVIGGACSVALIALIRAELARDTAAPSVLAWAFVGLCLIATAARFVAQVAMIRLGQEAVNHLCLRLCRAILALTPERFEEADPSALLAALTGDIGIIANVLTGIPELCINLPIVIACFAYIGWLSPPVLACALGFSAAALAVYLWLSERAMHRLRGARSEQDRLVGYLRALIDGFRELRQHRRRREAFLSEGLESAAAGVRDRTAAGMTSYALAEGWSQLAFFGFLGLVLFALPTVHALDRPTLAGVALVVLYVMSPLDVLVSWLPALGRAKASLLRIQELIPSLEARIVVEPPPRSIDLRDSLRLEDVTYAYRPESDDDRGFALGPVDLTLRRGEVVILAGGNGSGKTTLVKLISGLYEPHSGAIRADGRPVGPDEREAYRQLFSVVFADGYLFAELLGLDAEGLEARALEGLERLGLAGQVRIDRAAYSTVDLSQGQRRRLALLTALLEDRPVCIFDEWAANQDPEFKRMFYLELLPELKARGKALLVISHDEAYYDTADRVVRLLDGQVADVARVAPGAGGGVFA